MELVEEDEEKRNDGIGEGYQGKIGELRESEKGYKVDIHDRDEHCRNKGRNGLKGKDQDTFQSGTGMERIASDAFYAHSHHANCLPALGDQGDDQEINKT